MTQPELVAAIKSERARLDNLVASLDEKQLASPSLEGWSVTDLIAHITAWEQRCLGWIRAGERGEPTDRPANMDDWPAEIERFNTAAYAENRARPAADILADAARSYAEMLALVERLSDHALDDPARYHWTERSLGVYVEGNANGHYAEHADQITAWLGAERP